MSVEQNKQLYHKVYSSGKGAIINCEWNYGAEYTQKECHLSYENEIARMVARHNGIMQAVEKGFDNVPCNSFFCDVAYMIASAYGCPVQYQDNLLITRPRWQTAEELAADFSPASKIYEKGLYATVFERIEKMNIEHPDVTLSVSDTQSPIDVFTELLPVEEAMLMLYDNPELSHKVLQAITDSIIEVNLNFKEKIHNFGSFMSGNYLPFGLHMSDDNAAFLSPEIYQKFAVPYANQLSEKFGGVSFHICMKFEQNLENLCSVNGFLGFDAMPYYNDPEKIMNAMVGNKVWTVYDYDFSRPMGQNEPPIDFYKRLIDINENRCAMRFHIYHEDKEHAVRLATAVKDYAIKKGLC